MKIIDPHLHLFDINKGDYQWLKLENPPFWSDKAIIRSSFSEADLKLNSPLELTGFVHIEAGFDNASPWREVHWLEQTCHLPFRSIACVDLLLPPSEFSTQLIRLQKHSSLVGVRHILDEDAHEILSSSHVEENLLALANAQLIFECQMPINNTEAVNKLVQLLTNLPALTVIVNHAGYPPSARIKSFENELTLWHNNLEQLAQFEKVAIKCSGWEMADRNYQQQWLSDIVESCVDLFGQDRVMLASNFPLCLFSHSYQDSWQILTQIVPATLIDSLCNKNAFKWYKLELHSQ